jgi:beta-glucosidase
MNVEVKNDSTAVVTLTIKNTGKRTGTETAQIYISDTESSVSRPVKELKGFWQVTLKPGEEKVLEITLNKEPFAFYDNTKNRWTVEPGIFIIMAGSSSGDIRIQKEVVL